jgi:dinuclear metal center YbgI/SA1388 family protein
MKVKEIAAAIEKISPLALAQSWDNVGLLIGSADDNVKNIMLTIDITKEVLSEAVKVKTDLIICYHPVIWDGLKKINSKGATAVVYELIKKGIAVFSIHTALDAVVGGVNDGLADMIGIQDAKPIGDYVDNPAADNYKMVVFAPFDAAEKVANAIFEAGAGWIGNYSHCGFMAEGQGSFLPLEGAKPAIGKKGKFERVDEIRFETIVPAAKVEKCISAMRAAHPYEVPAFDIFRLHDCETKLGLGRIGSLGKPAKIKDIIAKIKKQTGCKAVGIVGDDKKMAKSAAVCAGTCGKILNSVIAAKTDLYLTGELKHHEALAAQEAGLTCICLSHTVSERFILKKFAKQLQNELNDIKITISKNDTDPFTWKAV